MRFLSVAEREMRAAARRLVTYYTRWLTGLGAFVILVWLLWAMGSAASRGAAKEILEVFSALTFCYCIFLGTARTADCLSSEKREGTLGLLFLTNLNSAEIVVGKLCSHALATVYGLLAIFPILALPLLLGGITIEEFSRTVGALVSVIIVALTAGLVASVLFTRQFPAVAFALGLAIVWGAGLLGLAYVIAEYKGHPLLITACAVLCPLYALQVADGTRMLGGNYYWYSMLAVPGLASVLVAWVMWRLSRSWRDRPAVVRNAARWKFWRREKTPGRPADSKLRRRLLDINPFYWLAGRKLVSAPIFMMVILMLVLITSYVTVPLFQQMFRRESYAAMIGSLFGWVWTMLTLHGLVLYYAAMIASQRLAEDKQTGALEMILCTPTTERSISRGLWGAFFRRMAFPAGAVVLLHATFLWQICVMCTLEPPGNHRMFGATAADYFWSILWNEPVRGESLPWEFVMIVRVVIFLLPAAFLIWYTLGWVGRWLGLKMKHAGFAPVVALALTFVPPIIGFSLICFVVEEFDLIRLPDRQLAPLIVVSAFVWGVGYCVVLCLWAAKRLRDEFRNVVTSRFQPPSTRHWWRPQWRALLKFALWLLGLGFGLVFLVVGIVAYQNWKLRRGWESFQAELQRRGEKLEFALPQPAPAAHTENLARQFVFHQLLQNQPPDLAVIVSRFSQLQDPYQRWTADLTAPWPTRKELPLGEYLHWINPSRRMNGDTNRSRLAAVILEDLSPHRDTLQDLARAARLPHLQITTNWDAAAVFDASGETDLLERVNFLFTLRASAALEANQNAAAAADVQTGLRLARLARQTPDLRATMRQQILLVRTLQPLWEGLNEHQWTANDLALIESELARFTLLSDYTNDVRRVTLAHLQAWRRFPDLPPQLRQIPQRNGTYTVRNQSQLEPGNTWYGRCQRLYVAAQTAMARVDVTNGWVQLENQSMASDDLPLSNDVLALMEPYLWVNPRPTTLAFAQAALNQAIIACALERYWLANREYPERLAQLVPTWLPQIPPDPTARRPMTYERIAPTRYSMRSFGADREDDRKTKVGNDWLWEYPTNAVPAVTVPK